MLKNLVYYTIMTDSKYSLFLGNRVIKSNENNDILYIRYKLNIDEIVIPADDSLWDLLK